MKKNWSYCPTCEEELFVSHRDEYLNGLRIRTTHELFCDKCHKVFCPDRKDFPECLKCKGDI